MYMLKFTNKDGSLEWKYFATQELALRWRQENSHKIKTYTLSKAEEDDEYWFTRFVPLVGSA